MEKTKTTGFLIDLENIESEKLLNTLNSITELCGIYRESSVVVMCSLCLKDKKQDCLKKHKGIYGQTLPLKLLKCYYEGVLIGKIRPSSILSEIFFIIHSVLTFYGKYEKVPGFIQEIPLELKIGKKGSIENKESYSRYRMHLVEYLVRNK